MPTLNDQFNSNSCHSRPQCPLVSLADNPSMSERQPLPTTSALINALGPISSGQHLNDVPQAADTTNQTTSPVITVDNPIFPADYISTVNTETYTLSNISPSTSNNDQLTLIAISL